MTGIILIAADGVHSTVRRQFLPDVSPVLIESIVFNGDRRIPRTEFDRRLDRLHGGQERYPWCARQRLHRVVNHRHHACECTDQLDVFTTWYQRWQVVQSGAIAGQPRCSNICSVRGLESSCRALSIFAYGDKPRPSVLLANEIGQDRRGGAVQGCKGRRFAGWKCSTCDVSWNVVHDLCNKTSS